MAKNHLHSLSWRNPGSIGASVLAVLLLCLGLSLAGAPLAAAHDQIISSTPTPGQRLVTAPLHIEIRFNGTLLNLGHEVRVIGSDTKNWVQDAPVLNGEKLTQPLPAGMPDGEYQVRWRVVSSDGHPINGSYTFLVGDAATAGSVPAPQAATTSGQALATTTEALAATSANGVPAWLLPAGIGAAAGLGTYLIYVVVLRRMRRPPASN
ncbi:hypothetical protein AOC05_01295 [Arthrobacter alpinus]|uniref:CopC domain-containing protein n=1 Tax=Arthrobacter alpinus TaxID=656366 RepID=A0A0M4RMG0_9MICC|nr:hypothetical protein AOC05_01295 [Arthrobacter alpinus]